MSQHYAFEVVGYFETTNVDMRGPIPDAKTNPRFVDVELQLTNRSKSRMSFTFNTTQLFDIDLVNQAGLVDVRIGEHPMGDIFASREIPVLKVRVKGSGKIGRIEVIKNNTFVHTDLPGGSESAFEFRDTDIRPGESYYYVRVEQAAGELAWSSPIWLQYSQ